MKRNSFVILIMTCFFFLNISPTHAEPAEASGISVHQEAMMPMFSNILMFQNSFDISAFGNASFASSLFAQSCSHIVIEATLQQLNNGNWTTIKAWSSSTPGTSAVLSGSYFVASAKFYRVVTTGIVYNAGVIVEQTTNISTTKYY